MDELRAGLRSQLDGRRGMLAHVVDGGEIAVGDDVVLV
jgi:MOSC domain-containing protein YiiM